MTRLRSALADTFRSLRIRNYRLFFLGQLVSLSGTWMQSFAQGWLVVHYLNGGGVALGVTVALQFLPMFAGGMWGGSLADRRDKRKLLIATQVAFAVLAATLATLTLTGAVRLWMVYALAFAFGCVNVVDMPTRQAFVTEMVGPEEVTNAVGLNSVVFNAARIVGPALGGILTYSVGLGWAFAANSVSYVAVIAGLVAMDHGSLFLHPRQERRGRLRDSLKAVWDRPDLRFTIILVGIVSTFGMNAGVVLPLVAKTTFHRGAELFATFTTVMAAGALAGALAAAKRDRPSRTALLGSAILFGASMSLVALAPTIATMCIGLAVAGGAGIAFVATANATFQLGSPPWMRGRIMALYVVVFVGSTPVGAPIIGWVAQHAGPRAGLGLGGTISLAAALAAWGWSARRPAEAPAPGFSESPAELPQPATRTA